jgi:hypothetical protein
MKTTVLAIVAVLAGTAICLQLPYLTKPAVSKPVARAKPAAVAPPVTPVEKFGDGLLTFDANKLMSEITKIQDPEASLRVAAVFNAAGAQAKGEAADELAALGGYEAVTSLLRLAALHEQEDERAAILEALKVLHTPDDLATLATTLAATRQPQFLDAVVETLGRGASPAVLQTLVELYRERNDSAFQKNQVLRAIAALRGPDLARPLGKLQSHAPEPALASAAATALASLEAGNPSLDSSKN